MTTYTWPTTRHFVPATHELRVVDNTQRTVESSLSGYVQTNAMPGARWGWGMDFTAHTQAQRAEVEAYLLRLSGRQHRVQLWDLRNPRPRGNIGLTGVTLGAAAAQFATSLTLAGCFNPDNLVRNGLFQNDDNADGLCNGLGGYGYGSVSGLGFSRPSDGTQRVAVSTLGSSDADRAGVSFTAPMSVAAGQTYTASAYMLSTTGTAHAIEVVCYNASDVYLGSPGYANWAGSSSYARRNVTFTAPAGTAKAFLYLYMHSASVGAPELWLASAQMQRGSSAPLDFGTATVLAGDWLGLTGGQLVRVVADATANDGGAMTVEVRHMLRAAVSSGTAVTLDKPTALYVRTESGLALPRQPGMVDPGLSLDLVEVFA